jgi:hypothetical protein
MFLRNVRQDLMESETVPWGYFHPPMLFNLSTWSNETINSIKSLLFLLILIDFINILIYLVVVSTAPVSPFYNKHDKKIQEVLGRTNRLHSLIRHGPHWIDVSSNSSIVTCVFITVVTFLPSRCLATIGEFLPCRCLATIGGFFTWPLPSNDKGICRLMGRVF